MDVSAAIHTYNLAHYQPLNPISAKHSIASDYVAFENGLTYPGSDKHCDHCGVYLIPGLTCCTKIAYKKRKKDSKRTRYLHVTCLACQFTHKYDALLNERMKPTVSAPTPLFNGKVKEKRSSELSKLLQAKKHQKQSSAAKSLSLHEFMSS